VSPESGNCCAEVSIILRGNECSLIMSLLPSLLILFAPAAPHHLLIVAAQLRKASEIDPIRVQLHTALVERGARAQQLINLLADS
jgi:hypothetical protein